MREGGRGRTEENSLICQRESLYQIKLSSVKLVEWRDPSSFYRGMHIQINQEKVTFSLYHT